MITPVGVIITAVVLLAGCGLEATDEGKEAYCNGIIEVQEDVESGELSPAGARARVINLIAQGMNSPDEDFRDDLEEMADVARTGDLPRPALVDEIAEACNTYGDVDRVF